MADQEITDLYREVILDHFKEPHNHERLSRPDLSAEGNNPLCGDTLSVQASLKDGRIEQISCSGRGCAISQASGSIMTDMVKGKELKEALGLIEQLQQMMQGQDIPGWDGDIEALKGARKFPGRVKCVTLAWHTLKQGIENYGQKGKNGG